MKNILSVSQQLKAYKNLNGYGRVDKQMDFFDVEEFAILFAKYHVKLALEKASIQASIHCDTYGQIPTTTKEAILNAYNLENIK